LIGVRDCPDRGAIDEEKKGRFAEEKAIEILKLYAADEKASEPCHQLGISEATLDNWKAKYRAMMVSEARRLKVLEEDGRKLTKLPA
jgi:putative transposase